MQVIQQFTGFQVEWSPSRDEFVYLTWSEEHFSQVIFAKVEDFQPVNFTPTEFHYVNILWHPSGESFSLGAQPYDTETFSWGFPHGWEFERTAFRLIYVGRRSYDWAWIDDELLVSQTSVGSGTNGIAIHNVKTEEGTGTTFDGNVEGVSQNYVILYSPFDRTIAILSQDDNISPEYAHNEFGTAIRYLSCLRFLPCSSNEEITERLFNYTADIRFDTDEVLVVTWKDEIIDPSDLISGLVPANLQLWDIDNDTLTTVISDGIDGRYSPDGNYLAYLTPDIESPKLYLFNLTTETFIFSQNIFVEADEYNARFNSFINFSPNGRFLTFFDPEQNLIIYDLENNLFLEPLAAVPITPIWSPDSSRFVYQEREIGLSIFNTRTETAYPLAVSGNRRLSEPQWSYDGTYLSVTVATELERETAVLQIP